jgi:hypothetical protein
MALALAECEGGVILWGGDSQRFALLRVGLERKRAEVAGSVFLEADGQCLHEVLLHINLPQLLAVLFRQQVEAPQRGCLVSLPLAMVTKRMGKPAVSLFLELVVMSWGAERLQQKLQRFECFRC